MTALLEHLLAARADHKLLVPYLMAGIPDRPGYPAALAAVGEVADAVEVGIPFSDPLMDGPVIAAAAERAIRLGVGPLEALDASAAVPGDVPRLAMTYYNPVHAVGEEEFCRRAAKCGFSGLIVPDLPIEESGSLRAAAAESELAWVPLVAPTTPPPRVQRIAGTATGFVYAVSTLGVTGVRESLSERAGPVVDRCREVTDLPVLVGIGVSTPQQAVEAAGISDGVVIGSAVVSRILEEGPQAAGTFVAEVRAALDSV
ncbi:MAG TPA: tryptophan synthase subunit alpha [Actinomycetota bacterium]|nr:tryptophan synthase subunit alpha [Actinomycetota bacterium]